MHKIVSWPTAKHLINTGNEQRPRPGSKEQKQGGGRKSVCVRGRERIERSACGSVAERLDIHASAFFSFLASSSTANSFFVLRYQIILSAISEGSMSTANAARVRPSTGFGIEKRRERDKNCMASI